MHDEPSDEELVLAVQSGNISGFEHLVRRYQKRLYVFANRIVRDGHDAQDVVQEVFIKVYTALDRIDPGRPFAAYVFSVAKNTAISHLRERRSSLPLDAAEREAAEEESITEFLIRSEREEGIRYHISRLKSAYRRVLTLYYRECLSYEEIASELKLPVNTVRTHLRRAKAALKPWFAEYEKR